MIGQPTQLEKSRKLGKTEVSFATNRSAMSTRTNIDQVHRLAAISSALLAPCDSSKAAVFSFLIFFI